jgi:hypothetical protein
MYIDRSLIVQKISGDFLLIQREAGDGHQIPASAQAFRIDVPVIFRKKERLQTVPKAGGLGRDNGIILRAPTQRDRASRDTGFNKIIDRKVGVGFPIEKSGNGMGKRLVGHCCSLVSVGYA